MLIWTVKKSQNRNMMMKQNLNRKQKGKVHKDRADWQMSGAAEPLFSQNNQKLNFGEHLQILKNLRKCRQLFPINKNPPQLCQKGRMLVPKLFQNEIANKPKKKILLLLVEK